ncbi:7-cyano-7-deazaguanine synthase QueC [Pseudohongiella spirulinae]|uniref:7-cyano-7-deazaguanine synthase n=1 Tax=Pseudohongiella spirulinae TaxID=1249552 RepID=A0A0S2KEF7_9GAMM|nr:7-cyano-7-deazaguanine synthase QueC [Pseudohongiella spirulinae]ALO46617.1 7-cyano-7-deazaguanine synthase [Pseudohongiella spirulinae]
MNTSAIRKAVILVSGGLDSATCLALAKEAGFECYALSFDYGQRASSELLAAQRLADEAGVSRHLVIPIGMGQMGGSALTDSSLTMPEDGVQENVIPITYVPARNTVFLSYALGWAEVLGASDIYIGVNALDYSGYPDCRPEFIKAFETMANLATRVAVEGQPMRIHTPLIHLSKAQIIAEGVRLGVDYGLTVSCYQADAEGRACGRCDSCRLRRKGFADAGVTDPTRYV